VVDRGEVVKTSLDSSVGYMHYELSDDAPRKAVRCVGTLSPLMSNSSIHSSAGIRSWSSDIQERAPVWGRVEVEGGRG